MTSLLSKTATNYQTKERATDSLYVPQPFLNYSGLTKMLSSDYHYIPKESSYQGRMQEKREGNQNGNTLFQNKKENEGDKIGEEGQEEDTIGFWIKNINTGDVYRSFIKGTNPWARSSAFTQPIQRSRGAFI